MVNSAAVTDIRINSLPSEDRKDYDYSPRPALKTPPISSQSFVHYLKSPVNVSSNSTSLLDRVPKKLDSPLKSGATEWGIYFTEDVDHRRIFWCVLPLLVVAAIPPLATAVFGNYRKFHNIVFWELSFMSTFGYFICMILLVRQYRREEMHLAQFPRSHPFTIDASQMEWSPRTSALLAFMVPRLRFSFALWQNAVDNFVTTFLPSKWFESSSGIVGLCVSRLPSLLIFNRVV